LAGLDDAAQSVGPIRHIIAFAGHSAVQFPDPRGIERRPVNLHDLIIEGEGNSL
jgi:hypothetical protein